MNGGSNKVFNMTNRTNKLNFDVVDGVDSDGAAFGDL
jgi:hypothetical protein